MPVRVRLIVCAAATVAALATPSVYAQPHVGPSTIGLDRSGLAGRFGAPVAVRDTVLPAWGRVQLATYRHAGAMQAVVGGIGGRVAYPTVVVALLVRGRTAAAFSLEPYDERRTPDPDANLEAALVGQRRTSVLCEQALAVFTLRSSDAAPCSLLRTRSGTGHVTGSVRTRRIGPRAVPVVSVWRGGLSGRRFDVWQAYQERAVLRLAHP